MLQRALCILVGYAFGCILTAEIVVPKKIGKQATEIGSGNPGMANVMSQLGFLSGLLVLMGDVLKTMIACLICRLVFPSPENISVLYAGLGAAIGHNFPFWKKFHGGKGVAVTCMLVVFYSPLWGLAACVVGLLSVLLTQYLSLGGVVIPIVYTIYLFLAHGPEAGVLGVILSLMMIQRNFKNLKNMCRGTEKKTDLLKKIKRKKEKE